MLVEDDESLRLVLGRELKRMDYDVPPPTRKLFPREELFMQLEFQKEWSSTVCAKVGGANSTPRCSRSIRITSYGVGTITWIAIAESTRNY